MSLALYAGERVKKIVLLSPPAAFAPFNKNVHFTYASFDAISNSTLYCKFKLVFPIGFTDDELQQIKTHALLLIGEKEVLFSAPKAIDRATRLMPNIHAEIIENQATNRNAKSHEHPRRDPQFFENGVRYCRR